MDIVLKNDDGTEVVQHYDDNESSVYWMTPGFVMNIPIYKGPVVTSTLHAFTVSYEYLVSSSIIAFEATAKANEKSETVKAFFDTGASTTFISERLVSKLQMIPVRENSVSTPSGTMKTKEYTIDIELPGNIVILNIPILSTKIHEHDLDIAIGMDIISQGDLVISNYDGKTKLSFRVPSRKTTNYLFE